MKFIDLSVMEAALVDDIYAMYELEQPINTLPLRIKKEISKIMEWSSTQSGTLLSSKV